MKKRTFFPILLFLIAFIFLIITFNSKKIIPSVPTGDTVAAAEFFPNKQKEHLEINLKSITAVSFPTYKITKTSMLVPDSISLAADEENVANGNYTAILTLDTMLNDDFIQILRQKAQKDTCWKIRDTYVSYTHREKNGGKYNIQFSTKGKQIVVTHLEL